VSLVPAKKSQVKSDEQRQQEADVKSSSTEPQRETSKKIEGAEQEVARSKQALNESENETLGSEPVSETTK